MLGKLPPTHIIQTPQITMTPTNGASVMSMLRSRFELPVVMPPNATHAEQWVTRRNW